MKKKIFAICLVVALAATAVIGGTLAYFTDDDEATNIFTVGDVKIDLTEPEWDETGSKEAATVYAGEPLAKDPTVENIGNNPCFVRIKVTGLDQFGEKGMILFRNKGYEAGKLNDGWVEYQGYYYWTKPLVVKGTENESWNEGLVSKTEPLFSSIVMPTGLTGGEEAEPITVVAQAVQAQGATPSWSNSVNGQPAVKDMSVEQIAAWFTTCGVK